MNDRDLEHPDITAALCTGYPVGGEPKAVYTCCECGEPIYEGDFAVHISNYGWICRDCIYLERVEVSDR